MESSGLEGELRNGEKSPWQDGSWGIDKSWSPYGSRMEEGQNDSILGMALALDV